MAANEYPTLRNATKALVEPESEEGKEALDAYKKAKAPAEALLRRQRQWQDKLHGKRR